MSTYSVPGFGETRYLPKDGYGPRPTEDWTAPVRQGAISVPSKSRRPRPTDLFLNATPAFGLTEHVQYGTVVYEEDVGEYIAVTSGPVSYFGRYISAPSQFLYLSDFGQADQKMRHRIKDQKVDLLAASAELRQTTSLFTGLATDVVQTFKSLRRGQPVAAVRRILSDPRTRADRALANRWLSYSFGVRPLMSDIYGLAEASQSKFDKGIDRYSSTTINETQVISVDVGLVRGNTTIRSRKRVRVRYRVQSARAMSMAQLGLTNPLASLWQVVPWSFAFDWLYDMGSYLEGFDALVGTEHIAVQRSGGSDITYQQGLPAVNGANLINGYAKIRQRLGVTTDLSLGAPEVKGILQTGSLGTRLANVMALIRQIIR